MSIGCLVILQWCNGSPGSLRFPSLVDVSYLSSLRATKRSIGLRLGSSGNFASLPTIDTLLVLLRTSVASTLVESVSLSS